MKAPKLILQSAKPSAMHVRWRLSRRPSRHMAHRAPAPGRQATDRPCCATVVKKFEKPSEKTARRRREARGEQSILGVDYPELAQQWHPTLNDPHRTPNSYSSFSVWPVWWLCPNSTCTHPHEWRTEIRNRAICKAGCPFCSGRQVCPCDSIVGTHPELAQQWHPVKNRGLKAEQVQAKSSAKVWWQHNLDKPGKVHVWMDRIRNRVNADTGCPHCEGLRLKAEKEQALADLRRQYGITEDTPPLPEPPPIPKSVRWKEFYRVKKLKDAAAAQRKARLKALSAEKAARKALEAQLGIQPRPKGRPVKHKKNARSKRQLRPVIKPQQLGAQPVSGKADAPQP